MKTLKKIKLNELSKAEFELKRQEMRGLKGASMSSGACVCVCWGSGTYAEAGRPIGSHTNEAV